MSDKTWQEFALCRGVDPDIFFPEPASTHNGLSNRDKRLMAEEAERAKAVCRECPVKRPCRDHADAIMVTVGVWGGESSDERKKRWTKQRRRIFG